MCAVSISLFQITIKTGRPKGYFRFSAQCRIHGLSRQLNLGNLNTPSTDLIQFYSWFNSFFFVFWGMVMYDNGFETKENKH